MMTPQLPVAVKGLLQIGGLFVLCLALWGPTSTFGANTYSRSLYVLHFMNMSTDRNAVVNQTIYVSSFDDTKIRIEIPTIDFAEYVTLDASNTPDRTYTRHFTKDLGVPRGESVAQGGILLVSDGTPIWAQVNKMEQGTTAAYLALPVTQHATEFFIPSYHNTPSVTFHAGFAVAGLDDGTCMEVYKVKGDVYERKSLIHLDALDVYTTTDSTPGTDYTGYFVNSTKPMAVFGGHECAYVPSDKAHCDAMLEQIPPVVDWGTEFILGPIAGRGSVAGYEFRVIAQDQNTVVTYTLTGQAAQTATIGRGQDFYSGDSSSVVDQLTATVYITCSKKCLVAQYNTGKDADTSSTNQNDGKKPDPFMMLVPPLGHYDNNVRFTTVRHFVTVGKPTEFTNYVTIVAKYSTRSGMRLDGLAISGGWTLVTGKLEYAYHAQEISPGFHSLTHTSNSEEFMAWVYGHGVGDYTGYGYMAAYKILDAPIADIDGRYDVKEPTTVAPTTTTQPWILGNWTDNFSQDDLPKFSTIYWAEFHATVRDDSHSISQQDCSNGYRSFFTDTRLKRMEEQLTANLPTICGAATQGSVVEMKIFESWFYTEYTQGNLTFAQNVIGSPGNTFREVVTCANKLRAYTEDSSNWPSVAGETSVNKTTFLLRSKDMMDINCDPVEMGELQSTAYKFINAGGQSWLCNGVSVQSFAASIISSAVQPLYSFSLYVCALMVSIISLQQHT